MGRKRTNLEEAFKKYSKDIDPITGCINWSGSIGTSGYGQMYFCSKEVSAHRYAYQREHAIKELSSKQFIDRKSVV